MEGQVVTATDNGAEPMTAARRLVPVLKALADENRLAILLALARSEHSVTELTAVLGLSQTLVSHHLKALREAPGSSV